jgi:hypothetical protein
MAGWLVVNASLNRGIFINRNSKQPRMVAAGDSHSIQLSTLIRSYIHLLLGIAYHFIVN